MEQISEQNRDGGGEPVVELSGRGKSNANLKPFKKGQTGNPKGHPKGKKNFATVYRLALEHLAKMNNTTPDAIELEIYANGLKFARKGDYRFYKDTADRLYGQASSKVEFEGDVTITTLSAKEKEDLLKLL